MGKGVIVEHLGDAHYRVGLDIDVSYARDQLTAINLYLDEFAPKYAEATQAKNDAQAALTPINDRLTVYLADAQSASQAAYDAMVAAYDEWLYAVEHQPDPGGADFLLDELSDAKAEFDAAHDQYIMALDGDPQAELTPEEALTDRTNALALLSVAMSDFQNGIGPLLDETAVNDALDLLGVALSDFENATVDYAADPGNPTLKSAMNYYRGVYDSAHSDWVSAVNNNSGDVLVQAKRDAYDSAAETFDTARENLGSLLGNGGMPADLASIMADQERAWATYHGALQNWQSLTLIKVEKESAKAELMSRLLPYTDPKGDPIRQTVNAWCCDLTEDMTVGAEVATIEIPGERDQAVRVRPGYESRETYSAARDGLLQPSWASSPEATYWNWALHPGNARWNPNYRLGEILFVDQVANTCTVQLDPQRNNEKSRARDGNTLDVINPVKYAIDPTTGAQTPSTPGDNVMVDGGVTTLTDVPIEYMECNAAVFEVGDHVMVEFQNRAWTQPKVIGFAENPKPCSVRGIVFSATSVDSLAQIKDGSEKFSHIKSPSVGGNYDWTSTDKRFCLTWNGPPGRAIRNRIEPVLVAVGEPSFSASTTHGYITRLSYIDPYTYSGPRYYAIDDSGPYVWRDGRAFCEAPSGHVVLGAALIIHIETDKQGIETKHTFVALASRPKLYEDNDLLSNTAPHTISLWWARVTGTNAVLPADWTLFHNENLMIHDALPMLGCVNFSGSGMKFAALAPTRVSYEYALEVAPDTVHQSVGVGNDIIVTGSIAATADGLSLASIDVMPQVHDPDSVGGTYTSVTEPLDDLHNRITRTVSFSRMKNDMAVVAMDYIGETLVQMSGTYSMDYTSHNDMSYSAAIWDEGIDYVNATNGANVSVEFALTDEHRSKTIQVWSITANQSGGGANSPDGGSGNNNASDMVTMVRPLFYDLRTGAAVYETGDATTSISSTGASANGISSGSSTCQIDMTKQITSLSGGSQPYWETSRTASATYNDTGWPFSAVDWVYLASDFRRFPIGEQAGGGVCQYAAYPWLQQWTIKSGSVDGITYVDRYARYGSFVSLALQLVYMPYFPDWKTRESFYNFTGSVTKSITTLPIYSQPGPRIGDLVARITSIQSSPDLDNWTVHFASKDERNAIFATGFDINDVWQAHLNTYHPPGDGEEQITQTALEANLKPEFRR